MVPHPSVRGMTDLEALLADVGVVALSADADGYHVTAVRDRIGLDALERVAITGDTLDAAIAQARQGVASWNS